MKNELVLIRGLPGSGKTTKAKNLLASGYSRFSADDYFTDEDGNYNFDARKITDAHKWCIEQTEGALKRGDNVIVDNTFTQRWEMQPYIDMAERLNIYIRVIDLFDGNLNDQDLSARNVHNVPIETLRRMRARYEHDWKTSDPRPPWSRKRKS